MRLPVRLLWRQLVRESNERATKQSEELDHRATASPDSHRFASYMEFPTGTGFDWGRNRRLKASRSHRIVHGRSSRRSLSELFECRMLCSVGLHRLVDLSDPAVLDRPSALSDFGPKLSLSPLAQSLASR